MIRGRTIFYFLSMVNLFFCLSCPGQLSQSYLNDTGNPSYGVLVPVENGYIDISNGNLHLELPFATHPQRGALKLNERLVYDSRIWMFSPFGTHGSYHWWPYNVYGTSAAAGGWRFITGGEIGGASETIEDIFTSPCTWGDNNQGTDEIDKGTVVWTDPTGVPHTFSGVYQQETNTCNQTTSQTIQAGYATDGSGYTDADDGTGNPIIKNSGGTQVYPSIVDRYGNSWSNGNGNGDLIDDIGRVPVITTNASSNVTYYDVLAPNGPLSNNGTRIRYTVTTAQIPIATTFDQSDIYDLNPGTLNPVQSILLPDGSQYTFSYDSYGELSSVTLPTGGVVTYQYSNFVDSSSTANRWLTFRQVGTNPPMTFSPAVVTSCANYSTGCVEKVTLHKPSGDETVYTLSLNNGAWNTGTSVFTGLASNGKLLMQSTNTNTYSNTCTNPFTCYGANYLSQQLNTTVLYSSTNRTPIYTQSLSTYDTLGARPIATKTWDYLQSASPDTTDAPTGTPTSETDYSYSGYDPYQVKVLDASGNQAQLITYGYAASAVSTSTLPAHTPIAGQYLQSVSNWLNTGGTSTATYSMYDTGEVQSVTDANSNPPTVYTYQCGGSLPYTVTNPLNQQTTYGYDCNSGAVASIQNANDIVVSPIRAGTTYTYEPIAGRISSISYPDHGLVTATYPSITERDTTIIATPNPDVIQASISDAFGRPYQQIVGGSSTETSYDANGRTYCITNPHSTGSAASGSTCISSYDGLDRPLVQNQSDGVSTLTWSYDQNVAYANDEASNQTTRTLDALGRLISVKEANGAVSIYQYDGLNNITTIDQAGVAASSDVARIRTFTYDSMSRVLCASHVESATNPCPASATSPIPSGVISYTYYPAGNVRTRTDARGITATYSYDSLNRIIKKVTPVVVSASGGTNGYLSSCFQYDTISGAPSSANLIGQLAAEWTQAGNTCSSTYGASGVLTAKVFLNYDAMGRPLQSQQCISGKCSTSPFTQNQNYDLAGNLASWTDGRGLMTFGQKFDGTGRPVSLTNTYSGNGLPSILFSAQNYTPAGALQNWNVGNYLNFARLYDARLRVASETVAH